MDIVTLRSLLAGLPVPQVRYFDVIGSTNDEAMTWIMAGAKDGCLVVADQQTAGRGRFNRRWVTHPGAALAFSVILHPTAAEMEAPGFFSALGALALSQALEDNLGLKPSIKWPNDVLLERRKAAGILVETAWLGDQMQGMIIGIGLNVTPDAVPPADQLMFPAISVAEAVQAAGYFADIDRWAMLRAALQALFVLRGQMHTGAFHQAWQDRLAFKDEWVQVESASGQPGSQTITGQVVGLDPSGGLLLRVTGGKIIPVAVGDVHLRPAE